MLCRRTTRLLAEGRQSYRLSDGCGKCLRMSDWYALSQISWPVPFTNASRMLVNGAVSNKQSVSQPVSYGHEISQYMVSVLGMGLSL